MTREAAKRDFLLYTQLLCWSGKSLGATYDWFTVASVVYVVCFRVCVMFCFVDKEVQQLQALAVTRQAGSVFNPNRKRYQRHFVPTALASPAKERVQQLAEFLELAYPSCTPTDWVLLWSDVGCDEQQPHADFRREAVWKAMENGDQAIPYAGKRAPCHCLLGATTWVVVCMCCVMLCTQRSRASRTVAGWSCSTRRRGS